MPKGYRKNNKRYIFDSARRHKFIELFESLDDGAFQDLMLSKECSLNYEKAAGWKKFTHEYNN
jgi:hypothetical protein